MARTLKSTGLAADIISVLAVDDDNTTIKVWQTPGSSTALTDGSGFTATDVSVGSSTTWKGSTVYPIVASASTSRIKLASPIAWIGTTALFVASSSYTRNSIDFAVSHSYLSGIGPLSTATPAFAATVNAEGNRIDGATAIPESTKVSWGVRYTYNANSGMFYGLESGSGAEEVSASPSAAYAVDTLGSFLNSHTDGYDRSYRGSHVLIAAFDRQISEAEYQSLHDDPFGTLFESGASAVKPLGMLLGIGK